MVVSLKIGDSTYGAYNNNQVSDLGPSREKFIWSEAGANRAIVSESRQQFSVPEFSGFNLTLPAWMGRRTAVMGTMALLLSMGAFVPGHAQQTSEPFGVTQSTRTNPFDETFSRMSHNDLMAYEAYAHFWNNMTFHGEVVQHDLDALRGKSDGPDGQAMSFRERQALGWEIYNRHHALLSPDGQRSLNEIFGCLEGRDAPGKADILDVSGRDNISLPAEKITKHQLWMVSADQLAPTFLAECEARRGEQKKVGGRKAEALWLLGLLRDYSDAARARNHPQEALIQTQLLEAYHTAKGWKYFGKSKRHYNGTGLSPAQSIVLGIDPFKIDTDFKEFESRYSSSLGYRGGNLLAMKYVDSVRVASGMEAKAYELEEKSVVNYVVGGERGNYLPVNPNEAKPFDLNVNWARLIWPNNPELKDLPAAEKYPLKIDFLTPRGELQGNYPQYGDHIDIVLPDPEAPNDRSKDRAVSALYSVNKDTTTGEAVSWSMHLVDANNDPVDPKDALGLVKNADDELKGDGRPNQSANTWWWGQCDLAAAARFQGAYGIPKFERRRIPVPAGDSVVYIPQREAQRLFDGAFMDILPPSKFAGGRFDNEPQRIFYSPNGEQENFNNYNTVDGWIQDYDLRAEGETVPLSGDVLALKRPASLVGRDSVEVQLASGTYKMVPGDQIHWVVGESQVEGDDPLEMLSVALEADGVFGMDTGPGSGVVNQMASLDSAQFEDLHLEVGTKVQGRNGTTTIKKKDRVVAAQLEENGSTRLRAWYQVDKFGVVKNSGFLESKKPDFFWAPIGDLNWNPASYQLNDHMPSDLPLKLLINAFDDISVIEDNAEAWGLPDNWRELRVEAQQ